MRARPLIWDHLTLIVARINALISFYTQFRILPKFFKKCVQNHIEASLSRSGQARQDGSLLGHDAASLQAADPPRQRVSELCAHADTAALLSLMWSAMPQKNLEFLGPRSGARKRTRICTPGSETRPEIGTRTWGHEIHVFSYKK